LRREALEAERWNLLHPLEEARLPFVSAQLGPDEGAFEGVVVAASDYLKALPDSIAKWLPAPLVSLGTDGFGRSGTREELRDFFEVDARHVVLAALTGLSRRGVIAADIAQRAMLDLQIDADSPSPAHS
jgi:pyruvate dehydrogenase E1 component